jgi:mRNA-degrading endonuclease RelE of RelBE toxin-antitoxin system
MILLMSYKIIPTEHFKQQVRELSKNYTHIRTDLKVLSLMLKKNSKSGKSLGKKIYKIRLKSSDISKGKQEGYRIITYVIEEQEIIRLLTIYAKPKKSNITDNEIMFIIQKEGIV